MHFYSIHQSQCLSSQYQSNMLIDIARCPIRAIYTIFLFLTSSLASLVPQQSKSWAWNSTLTSQRLTGLVTFPSTSRTSSSSLSRTTQCPLQCLRKAEGVSYVSWQKNMITKTITAETLVFVVNGKTNSTRTTTITNTEADLADYTYVFSESSLSFWYCL